MPFVDVPVSVMGRCELKVEAIEPEQGAEGCGGHLQLRVYTGGEIDEWYGCSVRIELTDEDCLQLEELLRLGRQELARIHAEADASPRLVCPRCGRRSQGIVRGRDGLWPFCACGHARLEPEVDHGQ